MGQTFQTEAICNWLRNCPDSFYLCDATGMGSLQDRLNGFPNVLYTPYISGKSIQSIERLSQKVLANMRDYLSSLILLYLVKVCLNFARMKFEGKPHK